MQNVTVELENRPGALAEFGEALGSAGISIEGGGAFATDGRGIANFLVADGHAARASLEAAGIRVLAVADVLVLRLRQDTPGQLGSVCRRMADANVNIAVQYSDHDNQLILVVDEPEAGGAVSRAWMHEMSERLSSNRTHVYRADVHWAGNSGSGTASYEGYGREFVAAVKGKPDLAGTAAPEFRGNPALHDPEDLFLTAIASCHLLSYLALCARHGVVVMDYRDEAEGALRLDPSGGGRFEWVRLRPRVRVAAGSDAELAKRLHEDAHRLCFIANSCSVPISHEAVIEAT